MGANTFLPQETLKTLYRGIVEPHFRYCCSVWGFAGSSELNRQQKQQNRAERILTNSSSDTPSRQLIDMLGWETIDQLIALESKTIVLKSMHEMAPQYIVNSSLEAQYIIQRQILNYPRKNPILGRGVFLIEGLKCGTIFAPKLNIYLL